jgi:hypothetical protein
MVFELSCYLGNHISDEVGAHQNRQAEREKEESPTSSLNLRNCEGESMTRVLVWGIIWILFLFAAIGSLIFLVSLVERENPNTVTGSGFLIPFVWCPSTFHLSVLTIKSGQYLMRQAGEAPPTF